MGERTVQQILETNPELFASVLEHIEEHEVQILYTQIDRDDQQRPHFREHAYRVDAEAYFYPASTLKLAGALLALEKLGRVPGIDRDTPLRIGSARDAQEAVEVDETSPSGRPSIAHYIRKLFVVSDNDAYNRLYEFVGQEEMNRGLWEKGYREVRLTHRLSMALSPEENRYTNPFEFYRGDEILYRQPAQYNEHSLSADRAIEKGRGELVDGALLNRPKDFSGANFMSVRVLQDLLRAVVFPDSVPPERRFALSRGDRRFLLRAMSMLPRECAYPRYDRAQYYDSYVKFFMFGDNKEAIPQHIRLFNKVGLAYGYLIDNAYIVDFERGVEFMLTAVISANENGIYNDGQYEYDAVSFPFLANLGRVIYEREVQRKKEVFPDLSEFQLH